MQTDGTPHAPDAGRDRARPKGLDPKDLERRRRARNWAMLAVLLGLAALFYAITLVKLAKGG